VPAPGRRATGFLGLGQKGLSAPKEARERRFSPPRGNHRHILAVEVCTRCVYKKALQIQQRAPGHPGDKCEKEE
jgi:hypothetical protein